MKFYSIIRFREYFQYLKNCNNIKSHLCNKNWLLYNEEQEREIFCFQNDGVLYITKNGIGKRGTWKLLEADNSIILEFDEHIYKVHHNTFPNEVVALTLDGTDLAILMAEEDTWERLGCENLEEISESMTTDDEDSDWKEILPLNLEERLKLLKLYNKERTLRYLNNKSETILLWLIIAVSGLVCGLFYLAVFLLARDLLMLGAGCMVILPVFCLVVSFFRYDIVLNILKKKYKDSPWSQYMSLDLIKTNIFGPRLVYSWKTYVAGMLKDRMCFVKLYDVQNNSVNNLGGGDQDWLIEYLGYEDIEVERAYGTRWENILRKKFGDITFNSELFVVYDTADESTIYVVF